MKDSKECQFCKIIAGLVPCQMVLEDEACAAFLDNRPLFPGHCLLVPRRHVYSIHELPDELIAPFFAAAKLLSAAILAAMNVDGTFLAMNNHVSQSVPHFHMHLVPRRFKDGLHGFFWPRVGYKSLDEMVYIQEKIQAAVEKLQSHGRPSRP
jgi:histidine triad (HIT) family protein